MGGILSDQTKNSFTFKKAQGSQYTSYIREYYEEFPGISSGIPQSHVLLDIIPGTPPAVDTDVVKVYNTITLIPDTTYSTKVWYAKDGNTRLRNFIKPENGSGYIIRVYSNNGGEIFSSNATSFIFDYDNGILVFENDPTNYLSDDTNAQITLPIKIKAYRYIGKTLDYNPERDITKAGILTKIGQASALSSGYLSSSDWSVFNNKQNPGNYFNKDTDTADDILSGGLNKFYSDALAYAFNKQSLLSSSTINIFDNDVDKTSQIRVLYDPSIFEESIGGLTIKDLGISSSKIKNNNITLSKLVITGIKDDKKLLRLNGSTQELEWGPTIDDSINQSFKSSTTNAFFKDADNKFGFNLVVNSSIFDVLSGLDIKTNSLNGQLIKDLTITSAKIIDNTIVPSKISAVNSAVPGYFLSKKDGQNYFEWLNSKDIIANSINFSYPIISSYNNGIIDVTLLYNPAQLSLIDIAGKQYLSIKDNSIKASNIITTNTPLGNEVLFFDILTQTLKWKRSIDIVSEHILDGSDIYWSRSSNGLTGSIKVDDSDAISKTSSGLIIKSLGILNSKIANNTIKPVKLNTINSPINNSQLTYDTDTQSFKWATASSVVSSKVSMNESDTADFLGNKLVGKNGDVYLTYKITGGNDTNTKVLLHFDSEYQDFSASSHLITLNGPITYSTNKVFGTAAVSINQVTPVYIGIGTPTTDFQFGTSDFTFDFRINFSSNIKQAIFKHGVLTRAMFGYNINKFEFLYKNGATELYRADFNYIVTPNTWYHIALVKKSNTLTLFINGISVGQNSINQPYPSTAEQLELFNCDSEEYSVRFSGLCDEFRVSNVARWSTNFPLPINPYSSSYGYEISTEEKLNNYLDKILDTSDDISEGSINKFLKVGSVTKTNLNSVAYPEDSQILSWNSSENKFEWVDPQDGGGGGGSNYATDIILNQVTQGLFQFQPSTTVFSSINSVDNILKELAPAAPGTLSGSLTFSGITFYTGYISLGNNVITYTPGQSINTIIKNTATFTGNTPNTTTMFSFADKGILQLKRNGIIIDSLSLETYFNESYRDGNQVYTPATSTGGYITVTSVGKYNNFKMWQKGNARINFSGLESGETGEYELAHVINTQTYSLNKVKWFNDNNTDIMDIINMTMSLGTTTYKYLDGVKYLNTGTQFKFGLTALHVFKNTYVLSPLSHPAITGIGSATISITDTGSGVSGVTLPVPQRTDNMILTDYTQSISTSNTYHADPLSLTWNLAKPGASASKIQSFGTVFINTYTAASDDGKTRNFYDNSYRLNLITNFNNYTYTPNDASNWDNTMLLTNGNALVYKGLRYPSINFATLCNYPTQVANYTNFSGPQVYLTTMFDPSKPRSGGVLSITGLTLANLTSDIKVELRFPGLTGWLDLGKPYDNSLGLPQEGYGCRVSVSGSNFGWTGGGYSTGNSGYRIQLRITFLNPLANIVITKIQETGWN
jgi:hypothetical protein